jgi:hypothetical protein
MPQNASFPGRPTSLATFCLLALIAAVCLRAPSAAAPVPARAVHPVCGGAVQHPLAVRVEALDPVRRSAALRLRVTTRADRGFERARVLLTSSGGAAVIGASRAELRAVPAGGQASSEFRVEVPARGARFLIQFRVEAEGDDGLSARGAAFNLLPDGPAEHAREAVTAGGEKLREVEARRIDR